MGALITLAQKAQAASGIGHFMSAIKTLKGFKFEVMNGDTCIVKEPVGVCAQRRF